MLMLSLPTDCVSLGFKAELRGIVVECGMGSDAEACVGLQILLLLEAQELASLYTKVRGLIASSLLESSGASGVGWADRGYTSKLL